MEDQSLADIVEVSELDTLRWSSLSAVALAKENEARAFRAQADLADLTAEKLRMQANVKLTEIGQALGLSNDKYEAVAQDQKLVFILKK